MTKTELEKWVLEQFWPVYQELCRTPFTTKYKPGERGRCIKAVQQLSPSEQLRADMLAHLHSQIRHRKRLYEICGSKQQYETKTKYDRFYCNRQAASWVNQRGWTDEIPSLTENDVDEITEVETCKWEDCEEPATMYTGHCQWHYTKVHHSDALNKHKEWLKEHGLTKRSDETREDWLMRCKSYAFENLGDRKSVV